MIVYFVIFILSIGGISVIAMRHKNDVIEFRFALFMENVISRASEWWYSKAHAYFLKVLEKFLRKSRILVLKIENFLFRKARVVRGISERNENGYGNGGIDNKKAEQDN